MSKKIIILLLLIVGVNLYSNSLYACNKPHKSTKAKSDSYKFHNHDSEHDCNKKCTHHNCASMSIHLTWKSSSRKQYPSYVGTNNNIYHIKTL